MPTITTRHPLLTLINVFAVAPAQQRLVELLPLATGGSARQVPGFVSASLHRSLGGGKVPTYAQ